MAKEKKAKKSERKESAESPNKKLLLRVRERTQAMIEADSTNRRAAMDDMKFVFVPGEQWDAYIKSERGERPCYEFNKTRVTVKRVINDMRANRPAGKVRAVEDGDKDTADVYEGLCRNVWNTSDGDTIVDGAGEYQVAGGLGAWRVTTDYISDLSFDQDICIKGLANPFCLFVDNASKDLLHRDARDWSLIDRMATDTYKARWPAAEVITFDELEFDDEEEWRDEDSVRVCEYWWKEPTTKEIWQLQDGKVIDADKDGSLVDPTTVVRKKRVKTDKIMMCIASGDAILEGPTEWAGSKFPFILVYGERVIIDGKVHWHGLTRFAKDAQRSYNVSRTAISEAIALAPNFKWWSTASQALGHTEKWGEAHKKNYPFMLYNADPQAMGPPQAMGGPQVPVALIQESQIASDEIKAVTGIFDNSLGQEGNETSGKAIVARQRQGEIATFNFQDNMAKGIRLTWEIIVDLIPKVIDTERQLRILGADGAEKYVKVNTIAQDPKTGEMRALNDLGRGRYDTTITVGPSFATQRQEAAEAYTELASRDPMVMQAAGDLVFKAMDLPYANEIAERYKALLPPPIQALLQDGAKQSPEVVQAMAQVQQAMQMVAEKGQLVTAAEQELKELQASVAQDQANAKVAKADLAAAAKDIEFRERELESAQAALEEAKQQALSDIQHAEEVLGLKTQLAKLQVQSAHQTAEHSLEKEGIRQDTANREHSLEVGQQLADHERNVDSTIQAANHAQQLKDASRESVP